MWLINIQIKYYFKNPIKNHATGCANYKSHKSFNCFGKTHQTCRKTVELMAAFIVFLDFVILKTQNFFMGDWIKDFISVNIHSHCFII